MITEYFKYQIENGYDIFFYGIQHLNDDDKTIKIEIKSLKGGLETLPSTNLEFVRMMSGNMPLFKEKIKMKNIQKLLNDRWENGTPHHPEALAIVYAMVKYLPDMDIKMGGDGDYGEEFLYALSQWIEDGKPDCVPNYAKHRDENEDEE
jgi:hypothetical protein